jgi:hypothetical protein
VRFDPDPAARSAGVRALRSFEAHAALESVALCDPSPAVRALAAQELSATRASPERGRPADRLPILGVTQSPGPSCSPDLGSSDATGG